MLIRLFAVCTHTHVVLLVLSDTCFNVMPSSTQTDNPLRWSWQLNKLKTWHPEAGNSITLTDFYLKSFAYELTSMCCRRILLMNIHCNTPGRRQSKPSILSTNADKNLLKQSFRLPFVANRTTNGNRKLCFQRFFPQFLAIFNPRSSILRAFSIAA